MYTSYHRVEITGRLSEELAVTLEPGDEILIEGEHQYRSVIDAKTGQKKTTCVLSTWEINQRLPAGTSPGDVTSGDTSTGEIVEPGPTSTKKGKPRYPTWRPSPVVEH